MSSKKMAEESKRKAEQSPETESGNPRLRRRNSLSDLQESADSKKSFSLPELMKRGFRDPEVMKVATPVILNNLQPQIEKLIETAFSSTIDCAVNKAIERFKTDVMQPMLNHKDQEIKVLKTDIQQKNKRITELESKVASLQKSHNDLEQYGRRQSIRLNNVPLPEESSCESVVLEILNKALPTGQSISDADIERCHPVGKPNRKHNRQIVVKFLSYNTKAKVYDARFNLKNIYMSEDLTKSNQAIVTALLKKKINKRIYKYWTIDGKIYAKAHVLQSSYRIKTANDIDIMISDARDRGFELGDSVNDSENEPDTGIMGNSSTARASTEASAL